MQTNDDVLNSFNELTRGRKISTLASLTKLVKCEVGSGLSSLLDLSAVPAGLRTLIIHSPFATDIINYEHLTNLETLIIDSFGGEVLHIGNTFSKLKEINIDTKCTIRFDSDPSISLKKFTSISTIDYSDDYWFDVLSRIEHLTATIDISDGDILDLSSCLSVDITLDGASPVIIDCPNATSIRIDGYDTIYLDHLRFNPNKIKSLDINVSTIEGHLQPSKSLTTLRLTPEESAVTISLTNFPNLTTVDIRNIYSVGDVVSSSKVTSVTLIAISESPANILLPKAKELVLKGIDVENIDVASKKLRTASITGGVYHSIDISLSEVITKIQLMGVLSNISIPSTLTDLETLFIANTDTSPITIKGGHSTADNIKFISITSRGLVDYVIPKSIDLQALTVLAPNYSEICANSHESKVMLVSGLK